MSEMNQPISNDALVLAKAMKLAEVHPDATVRALYLALIKEAKLLTKIDILLAEINYLKTPKLQAVEEDEAVER